MINITTDIEEVLASYARALSALYLNFDREAIQVVANDDGWNDGQLVFDIVLVISDEEELVLGEMMLNADFDLSYKIFAD